VRRTAGCGWKNMAQFALPCQVNLGCQFSTVALAAQEAALDLYLLHSSIHSMQIEKFLAQKGHRQPVFKPRDISITPKHVNRADLAVRLSLPITFALWQCKVWLYRHACLRGPKVANMTEQQYISTSSPYHSAWRRCCQWCCPGLQSQPQQGAGA